MKDKFYNNLEHLAIFAIIVIITMLAAFVVNRFFRRIIKRSTEVLHNDPTNYKFLRHAATFTVYIVGISIATYSVPELRALAGSILAGAGILAVAIGFASQQALSNIISGIFIVIFKPFRINDRLSVNDLTGTVEDITLRHTVIRDFKNGRIIIPNSVISEAIIINSDYEDDRICKWIEIGISYDSDLTKAKKIIREEILKHPYHIDHRTPIQIEKGEEEAPVKVVGFGDSSVQLKAWAWAGNFDNALQLFYDLNENIKLRFDAEGIEIPYPYRTIVFKEPLKQEKNE